MATPAELLAAGGCISCLDSWSKRVIEIRRTADWLVSIDGAADVSPGALTARSGCFHCLSERDLAVVKVRLLADIAVAQDAWAVVTPAGLQAQLGCWICLDAATILTLLVLALPVVVDEVPNASLARSGCYLCLNGWDLLVIEVRMLADILVALSPEADVTPNGLLQRSGCFACMEWLRIQAITALLASMLTASSEVTVTVTPESDAVGIDNLASFTAVVSGDPDQSVTWSVNGVVGGNATVGTISVGGDYEAPTTIDRPATVTVRATSVADPTAFDEAIVTLPQLFGNLVILDAGAAIPSGPNFYYFYDVEIGGGGVPGSGAIPPGTLEFTIYEIDGYIAASASWGDTGAPITTWTITEIAEPSGKTTLRYELNDVDAGNPEIGDGPLGQPSFLSTLNTTGAGVWTYLGKFGNDAGATSSGGSAQYGTITIAV